MRRSRLALALAALASLAARPAAAQLVTGRVVEAGTGAPLGSAVVALVDSAQQRVQAALADSSGRFRLLAPAPGTYALHVERVGSTSAATAPRLLRAGDSVEVALTLAPAPRLSAIRVTARERCRIRPADGEITARLWEEARKALVSTRLGETQGTGVARLSRFTRALDLETRRLTRETWTLVPRGQQLFRSPPAEELAAQGFVRRLGSGRSDDTTSFYAPDAEVLLSDAFLGAHCLRTVPAPPNRVGQLGLAVEPVPRRGARTADVTGTLWIDTTSFELRDFEFRYTDLPAGIPRGPAGGRVIFARLADGSWYVDHWMVSMPNERRVTYARGGPISLHAISAGAALDTGLVAYLAEEGGRSLVPDGRTPALGWATRVSGSLVDSTDGARPIVGARVTLVGTPYEAFTDDGGDFYLEVPLVGAYRLDVSTPRATSLGVAWDASVRLGIGRVIRVDAAIPTMATLRRLQCGDSTTTNAPLLLGLVQGWRGVRGAPPTLVPLPNAPVEVTWRVASWPAEWRERRTVRADPQGRFRVCELPAEAEFTVAASRGAARSVPWEGRAAAGAVLTQDLVLFPPARP